MDEIEQTPEVIFLGVADRAAHVQDSPELPGKWNIIGLKPYLLQYFFPANLEGIICGFGMRGIKDIRTLRIFLRARNSEEIVTMSFQTSDEPNRHIARSDGFTRISQSPLGWAVSFIPLKGTPLVLTQPEHITISYSFGDSSEKIAGDLQALQVDPAPLSPERIAAIKSDPQAIKAARAELACRTCKSRLSIYTAVEKSNVKGIEDHIWYQDLPDRFECECGRMKINLVSMRKNFYVLLGNTMSRDGEKIRFTPMYEQSAINSIAREFVSLIDTKQKEETIQKFLENNTIAFHQFTPEKIFFKPAILSAYKADFAILT